MNNQINCLDKLISSSRKKVANYTTGTSSIGLNIYRNKNSNVLILVGSFRVEAKNKYLNSYDVISEEKLFFRFFTGCTGPSSIDEMLESFDRYHDDEISNDISNLLKSLKASKIIICYKESSGASTAVILMLYKICKKMNQDYVPIIRKPASFKGKRSFKLYFTDLLVYLDTCSHLMYDESLCVNKLGAEITFNEFQNVCEAELLEIANSVMVQ
jgi:hypothetical protein